MYEFLQGFCHPPPCKLNRFCLAWEMRRLSITSWLEGLKASWCISFHLVLGLFGVSWVMPHMVLGLLGCWQGSFGRHRNGYIWSIIPHYLMWCLWRERNCRCFEDYESSISDLKLLFFRTLRDWLFALQSQSFPSFIDFLDSCNFCL